MFVIKCVEWKWEGLRMEMCIFIRIRFYCMNCIVIYNMFLMYINLVYFYIVCNIKNKIFDVGLENVILCSRNMLLNYIIIYNIVDNICKL